MSVDLYDKKAQELIVLIDATLIPMLSISSTGIFTANTEAIISPILFIRTWHNMRPLTELCY
ncbi:hypothetical protein THERMOT_2170 [Bathymodiolus thermophilus thioautotrophic gill symbiont]|uniref:hypothetical protein n=1 Tax=Bathymodiolus thermophilus thioautotrophic gill symbiont TaxID=2360 RepID=UPI00192A76DD|nr:hypothetical protein [Bathymodiolus thermophilus thioautotrophic gill symbiont]CAB5505533.1 hypothetical protein THERMOT_2170 [Bathymodiolus thermophilus thioautotrophic gill symbiont]